MLANGLCAATDNQPELTCCADPVSGGIIIRFKIAGGVTSLCVNRTVSIFSTSGNNFPDSIHSEMLLSGRSQILFSVTEYQSANLAIVQKPESRIQKQKYDQAPSICTLLA
jgi:hypothetical protein